MAGLGSERDRVAIAKPSQTRSFVSAKLFLCSSYLLCIHQLSRLLPQIQHQAPLQARLLVGRTDTRTFHTSCSSSETSTGSGSWTAASDSPWVQRMRPARKADCRG